VSQQVDEMFSRIADRYDTTNRFISLGTDRWVRSRAVEIADPRPGEAVLDCAAGTGDLTLELRERVGPEARVVGTDINDDMLDIARHKSAEQNAANVVWRVENAEDLPFDDDTFDLTTIAYGIRNVDEPLRALDEMARVTRPGGRVVVLEFGQPPTPIRPLYWLYNRVAIPVIGGLVSGEPEAYRYLQRTSDAFPCGDDFVAMLEQTERFARIESHPVLLGVNYIYRADIAPR
jgi:demethylmenaquinone methyltransferase/2-methoxy-6-polyprenyl-1,4-benzoquinol methylase